jgi:PAT family beta-lactamase induction signal transducer AmpG
MRWPNPLASRRGRLGAFFALYLCEGVPFGFTSTAIATYMRRQGLEPAAIGTFIAALYLPWTIKWAFGPFVDVLSSDRWGRRRLWIVLTQVVMMIALAIAAPIDIARQLPLFTAIIVLLNVASATQDVAIDSLAVNTLSDDERGTANGLMFGGQYLGQAVGGAGVLFLTPHIGFQGAFYAVAAVVGLVTLVVAVPMREAPGPPRARAGGQLRAVAGEIAAFARDAVRAFTGSRAALVGVGLAFLPMGAYALSLSLQSILAIEMGLTDTRIGFLNLCTTVIAAVSCILGGWLSDRFGRRRTLAFFIVGTTIPTLVLGALMLRHGWVVPVDPTLPNRPLPPPELVRAFWGLVLCHATFQGLLWGSGTAIYMDITTRRVAATQFTAYMAMTNFASSYSASWQGHALQRWGYPVTLTIDAVFGLVCLILLGLMGVPRVPGAPRVDLAAATIGSAGGLAPVAKPDPVPGT